MLLVKQTESIILNLVHPLDNQRDVEFIDLLAASGRILAKSVTSQLDFPHWDNSAMDGYAVRFADVENCNGEDPAILEIVGEIPAGVEPHITIEKGQSARILTGSMMPRGADTVVIQEVTRREENKILIFNPPQAKGEFVRDRASFYQAGTPLLNPGIALHAPEIAILAAAQCTKLPVYRRPRVVILSTGNELVEPDRPLKPGQIVDSNQYALAAAVAALGAEIELLGIIPDEPAALRNAISQAISQADVVLSTGGVSAGDYDYVEEILAALGGEIFIRSVAVKPGKPLTVARFAPESLTHPVLYFGLPGNPVSTLVTFWRFVQPALKKLAGLSQGWENMFVQARTLQDLYSDGKRESYLWGQLNLVKGVYEFKLAGGSHSSGNLINLAQTNGLAAVPIGKTLIAAGDFVQVLQVK